MHEETMDAGQEIICHLAFDPEAVARVIEALADHDVMVLGYTFEPQTDRGLARFWTLDPTQAVLALEGLGLDPRLAGEPATGGTGATLTRLRDLSRERA